MWRGHIQFWDLKLRLTAHELVCLKNNQMSGKEWSKHYNHSDNYVHINYGYEANQIDKKVTIISMFTLDDVAYIICSEL